MSKSNLYSAPIWYKDRAFKVWLISLELPEAGMGYTIRLWLLSAKYYLHFPLGTLRETRVSDGLY